MTPHLVAYEDLFDAIYLCPENVDHKERDIMRDECNKQHLNITIEHILSTHILINN